MPNNWGAGCVTAALLEGLAGIEDKGAGFRAAQVSPRWLAAGVSQVEVSVRYPASRGYVFYRYGQVGSKVTLDFTSCADKATLRVMLPTGARVKGGMLNGKAVDLHMETVEQTQYAVAAIEGRGAHRLEVEIQ